MKKILILPFLIMLFSLQVFSQTSDEKALAKAQKISQDLGLSEEQTEKIKNLFLEEDKKTAELKAKYGKTSDKSKFHREAKLLRDQTEKNIVYLLNATQKTKYDASKNANNKGKKK